MAVRPACLPVRRAWWLKSLRLKLQRLLQWPTPKQSESRPQATHTYPTTSRAVVLVGSAAERRLGSYKSPLGMAAHLGGGGGVAWYVRQIHVGKAPTLSRNKLTYLITAAFSHQRPRTLRGLPLCVSITPLSISSSFSQNVMYVVHCTGKGIMWLWKLWSLLYSYFILKNHINSYIYKQKTTILTNESI